MLTLTLTSAVRRFVRWSLSATYNEFAVFNWLSLLPQANPPTFVHADHLRIVHAQVSRVSVMIRRGSASDPQSPHR